MARKHRIIKCRACNCNNDLSEMIENEDFDRDKSRENIGYIYCVKCGNCIEITLK